MISCRPAIMPADWTIGAYRFQALHTVGPMNQQLVELERIHLTRTFPWIHLFKSFRLALDIRKMLLGGIALLVLSGGFHAFSYLPLGLTEAETSALRQPPWEIAPLAEKEAGSPAKVYWSNAGAALAAPLLSLIQPAIRLMESPLSWSGSAMRWTQILWAICVWSFFGTAISRMAAVQFAVDERVSLKEAGKFAGFKWLWTVSAPLMPIAGVLGLWLLCVAGGWIARIPSAGPILVGVFWFIPLLLSFAMVLLLLGLAFGWPLMVATISTQGSDAFDGFSRSFDYVYSRFWHLLWFVIVAAVHGVLMLLLVTGAASLIAYLAANFVGMGLGAEDSNILAGGAPPLLASFWPGEASTLEPTWASQCVSAWLHAMTMLVAGYAVSYFWSASTIIYFLLRESEDANHLSEVYRPKQESPDQLVQLAGVAASNQPIIERPPKHQPEASPEPQSNPEAE